MIWWRKKLAPPSPLSSLAPCPLCSPGSFALLALLLSWPLFSPGPYSALTFAWFFFKLLCLVLRNCRLPRILFRLDLYFPKIPLDALNLVSADKLCLESHRQTLALGLAKHVFYNSLYFHRSQIEREERRIGLGVRQQQLEGMTAVKMGVGLVGLYSYWIGKTDGTDRDSEEGECLKRVGILMEGRGV